MEWIGRGLSSTDSRMDFCGDRCEGLINQKRFGRDPKLAFN